MGTIFSRPRARPPLTAVSSQQNNVDVATENELLNALTSIPRSEKSCYGKSISIVDDIAISEKIFLYPQHSGLQIRSPSRSKISTKKFLSSIFECAADNVSIDGIYLNEGCNCSSLITSPTETETYGKGVGLTVKNVSIGKNATISNLIFVYEGFARINVSNNDVDSQDIDDPLIVNLVSTTNPGVYVEKCNFNSNYGFFGGISGVNMVQCSVYGNQIGSIVISNIPNPPLLVRSFKNRIFGNIIDELITIGSASTSGSYNNLIIGNHVLSEINTLYGSDNSIVGNYVPTINNSPSDAVTSNV